MGEGAMRERWTTDVKGRETGEKQVLADHDLEHAETWREPIEEPVEVEEELARV